MTKKLIISNRTVLVQKYGTKGFQRIEQELKRMIASDRQRGIVTSIHYVDQSHNARNPKGFKDAIDDLYYKTEASYIMLLGADDVVPHQIFPNPTPRDRDPDLPSDLPYASNNPFSKVISDFLNPSRVVGRLPDLHGSTDINYFVEVIKGAINQKPRTLSAYNAYFAVSAKVWIGSTRQSVRNIFGLPPRLKISPTDGPNWVAGTYAKRVHFVNCHGSAIDPKWYGEFNRAFPIAFQSHLIAGQIRSGTVVAAECCYGAQLYPNAMTNSKGICNQYLEEGSAGFFGSTNIAYGPPNGQGLADIITQLFIIAIRQGASVGRAALEARQGFIQQCNTVLNRFQLKTLGQFILLGDPSVHPIASEKVIYETKGMVMMKATESIHRNNRRKQLELQGQLLMESKALLKKTKARIGAEVMDKIKAVIQDHHLNDYTMESFRVESQSPFMKAMTFGGNTPKSNTSRIHTLVAERDIGVSETSKSYIGFVFEEENNKLLNYTEYHSK